MNIAGIDEAGRGALAGPVVAACVYLPDGIGIPNYIKDSKQLSANGRQIAFQWISEHCIIGIGSSSATHIDTCGIMSANKQAMLDAFYQANQQVPINHVLVDGRDNYIFPIASTYIIKGDCKESCISAASIVAKVTRDTILKEQHIIDDRYSFQKHKGYGTKAHYEALKLHGLSSFHRRTFIHLGVQRKPNKKRARNKN